MSDEITPTPADRSVAARLVRYAARSAPAMLAERLEEEWLADLAAQPSACARLSFALGCCWATRVIAREQRAASASLVASARGSKTFAWGPRRSAFMSRLRWLWIAAAALAVTALGMLALAGLVPSLYALLGHLIRATSASREVSERTFWVSLAITGAGMVWLVAELVRARARVAALGGAHPPRGAVWLIALVTLATSALFFVASAYFALTPRVLPGLAAHERWGVALLFAAFGALFLVALYVLKPRHDGGPKPSR